MATTDNRPLPEREKEILAFWEDKKIFTKSLQQTAKGKPFVFYEGPPSANGRPGLHHVLARAFKDIICRYQTMCGRYVARRAGWDTHGLPVEVQVEKELGLKSKRDIENIVPGDRRASIITFNQKCQESVWRYRDLWEKLTSRMGYWLDMENPYVTYEPEYIESLWWIISQVNRQGLLYQGHKILHWCPRCGTGLSSHEIAQGYQTVTDTSVFVKFKLAPHQKIGKITVPANTYILSWTTTPWTLPGNVALAVNKNIKYVLVKIGSENFIASADFLFQLKEKTISVSNKQIKGQNLIGLKYEPLFNIPKLKSPASHQIYHADFVTTSEGAGIVHTAVMYGEDDYELGQKYNLPAIHTVDDAGRFLKFVSAGLAGLAVKDSATTKKIISYLENKNFLLKTAPYEHEYPFCWRCDTPVIYYARSSWFIKMSALKDKLIKNNSSISWVPSHLKNGRFGEWLSNVKDWAVSRERYWATPLPIWLCSSCNHLEVIGSLSELDKLTVSSNNRFFIMRHGQALSNVKNFLSSYPEKRLNPLTPAGAKEMLSAAARLKSKKIDLIVSSDLPRAHATAKLIASALGIKKVAIDKRLRERDFGQDNGLPIKNADSSQHEPLSSIRARVIKALFDTDRQYQNKNILFISHGSPLLTLRLAAENTDNTLPVNEPLLPTGGWQELKLKRLPRNDDGAVDLHRPYIDEVKLSCPSCRHSLTRVPDLLDVWFDSGAMPFAAPRFPFAVKKLAATDYPADYISEAVDQTRGWFYTLLAVSTLLGFKAPYRHVISLGHLNDKHGQKMSKSRGNIVDAEEMMERYGADIVRWHFYTINQPGDTKNFDESDLKKVTNRVFNILQNSLVFYQTYRASPKLHAQPKYSQRTKNILDLWLAARLTATKLEITSRLDKYDVYHAALSIEKLIDDLSRWYIRRSRSRFQQPTSTSDHVAASVTLRSALMEISALLAPFTPFFAEWLYKELGGSKESIHLESWPKTSPKIDPALLSQMETARQLSSLGLSERSSLNIKVRQPLAEMKVSLDTLSAVKGSHLPKEIVALVADEVNVKKISLGNRLAKDKEVELDAVITPALREEGNLRELIRAVQSLRAAAGLKPGEPVSLFFQSSPVASAFIIKHTAALTKACSLKTVSANSVSSPKSSRALSLDDLGPISLAIK